MDLSILDETILQMDDSFLLSRPEAMNDDEVTQILKKWNLSNPPPKNNAENINTINQNETFDSRTFTRPKRRTFIANDNATSVLTTETETELPSMESGIASINLQVGGPMSSLLAPISMQRSWLNDVSPPSSICTSMDFQNCDNNMLNSLITSSDFTNVSFLLNGNEGSDSTRKVNATITIDNVTPTRSLTRNLMDFTFNVNKTTIIPTNATFTADVESPLKEFGVENVDFNLNDSTEDLGKNLTFNTHKNGGNMTWNKIQDHQNQMNKTIVQSTPVHNHVDGENFGKDFDHTMSPISSLRAAIEDDDDDDAEVVIRSLKTRKLVNDITMDDYRNSMEDQCEFLLNEETIKLSSRVCGGDTFECLDLKTALIQSTDAGKDFDKMLESFNVKKSLESEKLLQSVDNIKQRHSLINFEKQREDKLKKNDGELDNKTQYDAMNKSSERLLRRSRLYDDVNLQLQKQQTETISSESANVVEDQDPNDLASEIVVDKNNRDRFKTIKLNKKLQSGMVVVETAALSQDEVAEPSSTSPGTNKERRNQLNQQKQEDVEFKKPAPGISKFGFSKPTYRSRNDLNLPLKANSTDSLDNDEPPPMSHIGSNLKSPMGVKSKSIHNLMFNGNNGTQNGTRIGSYSNLRLIPGAARSQSNLKAPRASSLVRPSNELRAPALFNNPQSSQLRAPTSRKTSLVRPSSGYYGNAFSSKKADSDNESGCSLSSSSASSRNSVHITSTSIDQHHQNTLQTSEESSQALRKTGAIPKPSSGLRPPSNLRAPQVRSGLPRPSAMPIRR